MALVADLSGNTPILDNGGLDKRIRGTYDINATPWTGVQHKITIGAATVQSAAFGNKCHLVRIAPEGGNIHYEIGTNPVAVKLDSPFLANGAVESVRAKPGQKIAVIQSLASTGNVTITEDIQ